MNEWMGPDVYDLALFGQVVERGGFTAASRRTGVPQSSISRRIALLEKRLGAQLLERTTRRMQLTEVGLRTYEHVRLMLEQASAARGSTEVLASSPTGVLRVAAPVALSESILPEVVSRYLATYPDVSVALEFTTRTVDPLEDDVDIAIRLDVPHRSQSRADVLFSSRMGLFVPPSLEGADPKSPTDLSATAIFGVARGQQKSTLNFSRDDVTLEVEVLLRLRSNDPRSVVAAVEHGYGIALLPAFSAPKGWRQLLPDWSLPSAAVLSLTTRHGRQIPRVASFINLFQSMTM
ncbi:LysR family transcriptional regulator [Rhodobacterales bacterium HKCCE3408]|nr:LysR family transcriptional regulator [Rhodobacterales bacterium HKCCE3408]